MGLKERAIEASNAAEDAKRKEREEAPVRALKQLAKEILGEDCEPVRDDFGVYAEIDGLRFDVLMTKNQPCLMLLMPCAGCGSCARPTIESLESLGRYVKQLNDGYFCDQCRIKRKAAANHTNRMAA